MLPKHCSTTSPMFREMRKYAIAAFDTLITHETMPLPYGHTTTLYTHIYEYIILIHLIFHTHTHSCIHRHAHTDPNRHTHTPTQADMHIQTHMHAHMHKHTCTHTYMHAHMHKHTQQPTIRSSLTIATTLAIVSRRAGKTNVSSLSL